MADGVRPSRSAGTVFAATILGGSFLLFLVQPMVARLALPRFGGAAAVWNSAMLVYQALLLGGYAYAHWLGRFRPRVQAGMHFATLAAAALWLPIGLAATTPVPGAAPALWVPWVLVLSIGPLFFAVAAQAPLVQRWFALSQGGRDPYPLYAASNIGSFAGLIAYPLIVEPLLPLHAQRWLWTAGYALLVAAVLACSTQLPARAPESVAAESTPPGVRRILHWIALALVPSGLMLATSTYITTDIVAMPLLWVLPLGLYLLSFATAFAADRGAADLLTRFAPITILLFGGIMIGGYQQDPILNVGVALILLFMASVALHTALYRSRPAPDRLTGFYLATALGGALGGVFSGLLAPVLFDWTYEYPLTIFAAGLLVPQVYLTHRLRGFWTRAPRRGSAIAVAVVALLFALRAWGPAAWFGEDRAGVAFVVVMLVGLAAIGARTAYAVLLGGALLLFGGMHALRLSTDPHARTRSYFGVYTIVNGPGRRELDNGTTVHGVELTGSPTRERTPTTYYVPGSGVGQAMIAVPGLYGRHARIGVVGLGAGTLACYAHAGQTWRFYEIDPVDVTIARDSGQFRFLADCLPHPAIGIGDARVSLAQAESGSLDLLVLDAFASDAVPMHLMTTEAFATYARVLTPRGLLLVHVSNRFVDLEPVVAAAAKVGGWSARRSTYRPAASEEDAGASVWIALSRTPATIATLTGGDPDWMALTPRQGFRAWTDERSTILPLLTLGR